MEKSFCLFVGWFSLAAFCTSLPAQFLDVTDEVGLSYVQQDEIERDTETHLQTGGAAAADFDGDGWTDLFVTRMQLPDILFRNLGPDANGVVRFEDVSLAAGFVEPSFTNGVSAVDIDNDGDVDLYLSTIYESEFRLYINNGEGVFEEDDGFLGANLNSGLEHSGFSISAGDYDKDGWVDFHTTEWNISAASEFVDNHSVLLRNFGSNLPGHFQNATERLNARLRGSLNNPTDPRLFGFSSRFVDMDLDGWQDIVVAADFASSEILWNEEGQGFVSTSLESGIGLDQNGMGLAVGDFDSDGLPDFFVSSIGDHRLYRNLGDRKFEEVASQRMENVSGWGWGSSFLDYDNDGDLDLALTTGYEDLSGRFATVRSVSKSRLWRNDDGFFADVGEELGIVDDGPGKALLVFDYDQDGRQDIFIVNTQSTPVLYRNVSPSDGANWLQVQLVGAVSNREGLGAVVSLLDDAGQVVRRQERTAGSNFLSQNEPILHFGLGEREGPIDLRVEWPSGKSQLVRNLRPNMRHTLYEPASYVEWETAQLRKGNFQEGLLADEDGDGYRNEEEYLLGGDPLRADRLVPLAVERASESQLLLRLQTASYLEDVAIVLQLSDDLLEWSGAAEVGTSVEGEQRTGALQVADYLISNTVSRFWRLAFEAELQDGSE